MEFDALLGLSRLEANTEEQGSLAEARTSFAFSRIAWKDEAEEDRNYNYVCDRKKSNVSVLPVQALALNAENAVEVLAPFVTNHLHQIEAQGQRVSDIVGFTIFHKPENCMEENKIKVFFADSIVMSSRDQFMCLGYNHGVREGFPVGIAKDLLKTYNSDAPRWHPFGLFDEQNKKNIELALEKHPNAKAVVRYEEVADRGGVKKQTVAAVEDDAYIVHRRSGQIVGWKGRLATPAYI